MHSYPPPPLSSFHTTQNIHYKQEHFNYKIPQEKKHEIKRNKVEKPTRRFNIYKKCVCVSFDVIIWPHYHIVRVQ